MSNHTHILASSHYGFEGSGENRRRVNMIAGTRYTPTESELKNMPDKFMTSDGHALDRQLTRFGLKDLANSVIKDLANEDKWSVEDLHEMIDEEAAGKNRSGAISAITARIEELEEPEEE